MNNLNKAKTNHIEIKSSEEGQRLDNFLLKTLKNIPRSLVYKFIRSGQVRVNKKRTKQLYRIKSKDIIRIPPYIYPGEVIDKKLTVDPTKYIHFENDDFMLLNKPSGIAVHSGTSQKFDFLSSLKKVMNCNSLSLIHRLDKNTSGCLLIAKSYKSSSFLGKAMMNGLFSKKYIALLYGVINKNVISVSNKILKDTLNQKMVISKSEGKDASTVFKVIKRYEKYTLVQALIETGRTHQVRVHAHALGHPIVGDKKYTLEKFKSDCIGFCNRLFLHSDYISFKYDRQYEFNLDLPNDLKEVLSLLEIDNDRR